MDYIEVSFIFNPVTEQNQEIMAALLGQAEFESFSDTNQGLQAYIQKPLFNETLLKDILKPLISTFESFDYSYKTIKDKNWNAEWEKNFNPIYISDNCRVRAPFHTEEGEYEFDLIIEPKMSFGTGHSATTALMIKMMLDIDFSELEVLDMGCGPGILAILASLKKAKNILAVDIDNWAFENSIENVQRNNTKNIVVKQGDANLLSNKHFDIILANINRNILLKDLAAYSNSLKKNGQILLSGFYTQDLQVIKKEASRLGLKYEKHIENENWVAVKISKPTLSNK